MKKMIGAIRWDAWVGDANPVGLEVEKTLSNSKYYHRLPFYSKFNGDKVKIRCIDEDTIKREVEYAYEYGIDYFAFCWYPHNSGLDIPRRIFLNIKQNLLKWCLILGTNPFNKEDADWLIKEFASDSYLKIENRPVIFLFDVNESLYKIVDYIRKKSNEYLPYFVGLVWNVEQAKSMNLLFELDALSQYATPGKDNLCYNILSSLEEDKWKQYLDINKVVPWVTTGRDKRPRFDNPVSWEICDNFVREFIQFPTILELKHHFKNAIDFSRVNESDLILIYAWNEFDEGGFIEPTLSNGKINFDKLEAIKDVIDKNLKM